MRRALALTLLCTVAFVHSVCAETIPPRGSIDPRVRTVTFIPGKEFIFGSFNFITGIDGKLHVSNLEVTQTS